MADIEYSGSMDPEQTGDPLLGDGFARVINILAAVASVALLIGIGIWGYKLVMRDVSGVPVVSALEGPMRVQPDDPGGREADHQGLAVNAVAALGTAEPPADRLMLAPRPVELVEEDRPLVHLISNGPDTDPSQNEIDALVERLLVDAQTAPKPGQDPASEPAQEMELAAAIKKDPLITTDPVADSVAQIAPQPAVVNGVGMARSLRPMLRPASFAPPAPTAPQAPVSQVVEIDPGTLAIGTRLAQLGAFDDPDQAHTAWVQIENDFSDYFAGKSRIVQRAESGGRVFYRLRAHGFDDIADARRFCAVLIADGTDCIPVTIR